MTNLSIFAEPETRACIPAGTASGTAWIGGQTQDPAQCRTPYFWKPVPLVEIPFTYTNWIPGQPDCWRHTENCINIESWQHYRWNDAGCQLLLCSVCEL